LEKIGQSTIVPKAIPKSSAQLCIMDPFHSTWGDREGKLADLMATHPPLRERIARLRSMAYLPDAEPIAASPASTAR
jgi:Zn-dependent protease with chaperone function